MRGESSLSTQAGGALHRSLVLVAIAMAAGFAVLYWVSRPAVPNQSWDSLSFGYAAETVGIHALWSNHPLGHAIFGVALWLARYGGYTGRGLPLFQVINSFAGGLAVAGLFILFVTPLRAHVWVALGSAGLFGACAMVWYCAGTAEIYTLSLLSAVASWVSLLYQLRFDDCDALWLSGICAGIAVLAHQLNVLLLMGAVLLIPAYGNHPRALRRLATFLTAAACVIVVGYGALGYLATESTSPSILLRWPRGYIGESAYGGHLRFQSIPVAWAALIAAIVRRDWTSFTLNTVRATVIAILCASTVCTVVLHRRLDRLQRAVLSVALLESTVGSIMITWWEPFTQKYWVFALLPWVIALGSGGTVLVEAVRRQLARVLRARSPDWIVAGLALGVFLLNLRYVARHEMQSDPLVHDAVTQWLEHSRPEDVLIPPVRLIPQLRFWENRPNVLLLSTCLRYAEAGDALGTLRDSIDGGLMSGASVLYAPAAIGDLLSGPLAYTAVPRDTLERFFERYGPQEAFSYVSPPDGKPIVVYRLIGPPSADGDAHHVRRGPC